MAEIHVEKAEEPDTSGGSPTDSKTVSPDVEMEDVQDDSITEDATAAGDENTLGEGIDIVAEGEAKKNGEETEEKEVEEDEEEEEEEEEEESLTLPLSKIKKIFKMDADYIAASQGAVYATGLATELFIQYLVEQASSLAKRSKRKKIMYSDFSDAVKGHDSLIFLKDTVPEKQKLADLLARNIIDSTGRPTELNPATAHTDIIEKEDTGNGKVSGGSKAKNGKNSSKPLIKGQQTLNFSNVKKDKPIKKAVIHDLIANDIDDEPATKDVVMIE
ncbi:DNA polymerase epsilon subunit C [[Candida] railenensis]|uniref:DNA polymerase epsilon subunit C n=1 Tax=[Candida] railenensis TaxID=45579 RepID=A0A9P0VW88_9ASCO|nr:DNA polymerase epsilon subunit C [[Candida] railenensis]